MKIMFDESGRMQLSAADAQASEMLKNYFDVADTVTLDAPKSPKTDVRTLRTSIHKRSFSLKKSTEHITTNIQDNVFSIAYWVGIGRTGDRERANVRKQILSLVAMLVLVPFIGLMFSSSSSSQAGYCDLSKKTGLQDSAQQSEQTLRILAVNESESSSKLISEEIAADDAEIAKLSTESPKEVDTDPSVELF